MPVGAFVRRKIDDGFKTQIRDKLFTHTNRLPHLAVRKTTHVTILL